MILKNIIHQQVIKVNIFLLLRIKYAKIGTRIITHT